VADILLTHSNHVFSDWKQAAKMQPYPPLHTLICAAHLRNLGHSVAFFDPALTEDPDSGLVEALERHRPRLLAVVEDNFNFLTKMCLLRNRELSFRFCAAARQRGIPAVVNGSDATDRTASYLEAGFEMVLLGEVEPVLAEAAAHWLGGGGAKHAIRSVAYLENGAVRRTPPRPPNTQLDDLPGPAWELACLAAYRRAWVDAHGHFSMNLVSSRGCPYRCNWCAKPIFASSYHFHSPLRVANEMLRLKNEFSADRIWFADDIFALSAQWTREFADAVGALHAALPFKMQSRCDLMTRGTVDALRRAGCSEVWMGAESGSQKILDAMDKGSRVEHTFEACRNLRAHGIRACLFLQFGYPGETWQDIEQTISMVRKARPDDIGVSVAYPLPGTVFHDRVALELGDKRNWTDSGDLALMFQGSYSSDMYRALADALHQEVRGGAPDWKPVYELERHSRSAAASCTSC